MSEFIQEHFTETALVKVAITIIVCLVMVYVLKALLKVYLYDRVSHQSYMIFSKIIFFVGFTIMGIVITSQLGFESLFTTILGSAGIAGVAIGFASKTSLENLISGILLLSDKSFKVDDIIHIDNVEGTLESIDSLSIKIRTFDNQLVRVPNVKVLNSNVANLYPDKDRRKDISFKVSYDTDLSKVERLLRDIANNNPYIIRKEDTYVYFSSFENIGYKIKYGVWFPKGNITLVTNSIIKDISQVFENEGIKIPVTSINVENT